MIRGRLIHNTYHYLIYVGAEYRRAQRDVIDRRAAFLARRPRDMHVRRQDGA